VKESLSRVVLSHINAADPEGKSIAGPYGIYGYPTLVLVDAEGRTIDRWIEYSRDRFLNTLDEALGDLTLLEDKRARHEQAPSAKDAAALGRDHQSRRQHEEALAYFRAAQRLGQGTGRDYSYRIFAVLARRSLMKLRDPETFAEVKAAADAVLSAETRSPVAALNVCGSMASMARRSGRDSLMAHYLRTGIEAAEAAGEEMLIRRAKTMASDYALYVEKDTARAAMLMKAAFPANWEDDVQYLLAYSHWCSNKAGHLEESRALGERAVSLASAGDVRSRTLFALAMMRVSKGRIEEALELLVRAEAEDPTSSRVRGMLKDIRRIAKEEKRRGK
jgi:tetratricopeptide (TPR) repeat protein